MDNKSKGIIFILISSLSFAVMGAFVKLSGNIPSIEKSFFRNLVSCIVAFFMIIYHKNSFFGKRENQKYLFWRAFLGTLGVICYFYAIDHMVLSDSAMLNKLSPFFVTIFAVIFLKEKIRSAQIAGLFTAFIGGLLIIKPSFNISILPALIGLASAVFAGGAYTIVRFLGSREKYYTIVFYFSFFSIVSTLPFMLMVYKPLTLKQIIILIAAGVFASIGQFALTIGYKYAPASEIAIYDYVNIIFSAIIGQLIWSEIPDILSIIGYIMIIGSSIIAFIYNKRRVLRREKDN